MSEVAWSRRQVLRSTLLGAAAIGAPGLLGACSKSAEAKKSGVLAAARKQGFIRVGFANEAPFGFADAAGRLTGQAPEVARAIFKELGVPELQGALTEFGSLIPGLRAGRFDVIAAGMFINPERCKQILFSVPDYCSRVAFLVRTGNPAGITRYEDVAKKADLRLGVLSGAVEADYAMGAGVPERQLVTFNDPPSGVEGLISGRIDAFSLTSISLRNLLSNNPAGGLLLTEPFVPVVKGEPQAGCGGYGFRKDDEELLDAFNEQLTKKLKDGTVLGIIEPFGFSKSELATDHTTAELCKG